MQKIKEAFTFDDVLIVPSLSSIKPNSADVSTKITKKLKLNLPLISSAMDTVTESALAIKMAQEFSLRYLKVLSCFFQYKGDYFFHCLSFFRLLISILFIVIILKM